MKLKQLFNKTIMQLTRIPTPVKASIIFIIASILTQGLSIITMPIFTRIMTPSDMGTITIYNSWNTLIGTFAGLALSSGSFNIAMNEYKDERNQYISSILILSTVSSILLFTIYIFLQDSLVRIINIPTPLIYLMFIGFILSPATNYWILKQRYEYKYKTTALVTILSSIISTIMGVSAVLIVSNNTNLSLGMVRIFATTFIPLLIALVIYVKLIKSGKTLFNMKYWSFALTMSLPLLLHTLAKQVLDVSDRVMIQYFTSDNEVGIYGVLYTVSSLSLIVWSAINGSLVPFMFKELDSIYLNSSNSSNSSKLKIVINPLIFLYFIVCISLMLIAPEIVKILATQEYYEAIYLVPPIAASIFFTSLYNIFSNVLLYYKKTRMIMISTLLAAIINIILNVIFIPKYGFVAAAYTTLVSYVFLALFQYISMRHITQRKMLLSDKLLWGLGIIMIIISSIISFVYKYNLLRYSLIIIIVTTIIILALYNKKLFNKLINSFK